MNNSVLEFKQNVAEALRGAVSRCRPGLNGFFHVCDPMTDHKFRAHPRFIARVPDLYEFFCMQTFLNNPAGFLVREGAKGYRNVLMDYR